MHTYNVIVYSTIREVYIVESPEPLSDDELRNRWSHGDPIISEVLDVQEIEIEEV